MPDARHDAATEDRRHVDLVAHEAGEELASPSAWLAAIVESSEDAIIAKRLDGTIVSWNRAAERLYGWRAEEAVGRSVSMLLPPGSDAELRRILDRLARGERIRSEQATRVRRDGTPVEVLLSITPIRDGEGRIVGAATTARDRSEHRRLERAAADSTDQLERANAELREIDRARSRFLALAAHELRTPLTSMMGFTSMVIAWWEAIPDAERLRHLANVESEGRRLTRLVERLLVVAQLDAGMLVVHHERLDLVRLVREALGHLGERRDEVTVDIPAGLEVRADHDLLVHALHALLENALRHGAPPVAVSAAASPGAVEICVSDRGPGVPAAFVPHLFRPFRQWVPPDRESAGGFGLSLSVVDGLVRAHGGRAWYEPVEPHGAAFSIRLPA